MSAGKPAREASSLRIVFMGSSSLACPSLELMMATPGFDVVGVVTQPDRPRGRSLQVAGCPVATDARRLGAAVITPENVNAPENVELLRGLKADVLAVAAYGQILRRDVLEIPRLASLNLHGSLLPKYRGAAPIQWAVANGDAVTGVTVIHMNERMDAGDMVLKREVPILPEDTGGTLSEKMALVGAQAFVDAIIAVRDGTATRVRQDESMVTVARKLTKHDGVIDWSMSAEAIHNRVRGFNPWPCAWTSVNRETGGAFVLRVLRTRAEDVRPAAPGTVVLAGADGPVVATGRGGLALLDVQPEGKRAMGGADFLRGHPIRPGAVLGGAVV